jgi:hypothetical protein
MRACLGCRGGGEDITAMRQPLLPLPSVRNLYKEHSKWLRLACIYVK